jgi:dephospho-CoA kinase
MNYKNPLIIGVTGGMGSGQSTVCKFLEELGCKVISADEEAKNAIRYNRDLQDDLKNTFGKDIFYHNHQLNAKRLAALAFKDDLSTRKLNQLVHPRMVENLIEKMENARFSGRFPMIVIDAALIYEISIESNFDRIIVVNAAQKIRQQRVAERDHISKKEFLDRVNKQIPLEEKCKWADFVIDNNSTLDELKEKTIDVFNKLSGKNTQNKSTGYKRRKKPVASGRKD